MLIEEVTLFSVVVYGKRGLCRGSKLTESVLVTSRPNPHAWYFILCGLAKQQGNYCK